MNTADAPRQKYFRERIGTKEYDLQEDKLDVLTEVTLWNDNPRLVTQANTLGARTEETLEAQLKMTGGYEGLARSIADIGQMEPIYVWKNEGPKYVVLEGATRVTILRDLARKAKGQPDEFDRRRVKVKILPPDFGPEERVILLAKIHVRGSGVRDWGRYIEAEFIHNAVVGKGGNPPLMSISTLASHMGKSVSWVSRLKDAYLFAAKFVEHVDADDDKKLAAARFSILEEIVKSPGIGPKLKDYENAEHDELRGDVFDMVKNGVFKEYRDARFMKQYYDDFDKWNLLKTGEVNVANRLANELRAGNTTLKSKIEALPAQIERAIDRDPNSVTEDDLESLRKAVYKAESVLNPGVNAFRLSMNAFSKALEEAGLADIKTVQPDDMKRLDDALGDFRGRLDKHKTWN